MQFNEIKGLWFYECVNDFRLFAKIYFLCGVVGAVGAPKLMFSRGMWCKFKKCWFFRCHFACSCFDRFIAHSTCCCCGGGFACLLFVVNLFHSVKIIRGKISEREKKTNIVNATIKLKGAHIYFAGC